MPHRCTKCGKIYPDGDSRILKGCECGNNRFEYVPRKRAERVEERVKEAGELEKRVEEETWKTGEAEEINEGEEKPIIDIEGVESVRILSPGMYEINLEKVFSRDEIVIALQEEGRYAIHLPSLVKSKEKKYGKKRKKKE